MFTVDTGDNDNDMSECQSPLRRSWATKCYSSIYKYRCRWWRDWWKYSSGLSNRPILTI